MKPRKHIASISPKKRASRAAYNREARRVVMLANERGLSCIIAAVLWGEIRPLDCNHHLRGRACDSLLHDKRGWLLISDKSHSWIDLHRAEARERGWLAPLGKWNTPFKPDEPAMPGSVADLIEKLHIEL